MGKSKLSSELLFLKTDKLSLFNIHDFLSAQLIFKYFQTPYLLPKNIVSLFTKNSAIHELHTRSSDTYTLHTHLGKLHVRAASIKIYGAFLWNKIPHAIRFLPTLVSFKKSYKSFLLNTIERLC